MNINLLKKLLKQADYYESEKKYYNAIKIYDKILLESSDYAKIFALRGYNYFYLKKYKKALEDFNNAIEIKADVPTTLYYRARTFEHLDKLEDALSDYLKSAKLSPEVDVFINISLIKKYQNKIVEAKKFLDKAYDLEPNNLIIKNLLKDLNQKK